MGFEYKEYRRGVYFDGHERDDVVDYRKEFLEKMKELVFLYINLFGIVHLFSGLISIILFRYERLMPLFEGEDLNIRTDPDISSGESLHILVTHDESLFHANDGRKSGWVLKMSSHCAKRVRAVQFMSVSFCVRQLEN